MKIFFRFSLLIFCVATLTGCVGVLRVNETAKQVYTPCDDKNQYCWIPVNGRRDNSGRNYNKPPSKAEISSKYGQPLSISRVNTLDGPLEVWDYRNDLAWRGFMPVFFLPLPLLVPAGFNHIEFGFKNDEVANVSVEYGAMKFCGLAGPMRVCE